MTSVFDGRQPLALTDFQVQVARLFFSLPAAQGFLLAGGAALVAQHLTSRPTQDLDRVGVVPWDFMVEKAVKAGRAPAMAEE